MRFGAYETAEEIGRGGMAIVFRARGPRGETVALKVLAALEPEVLALFERETRLLATLRSNDGVVPILDSGSVGGRPYIVMPLLGGGTLRDRLDRRKKLERAEAVALVRRLAEALGRAHERGIVHRDVKPGNVLFDAEGNPFVADLGFAKHFTRDVPGASQSATVSATGTIAGTAGYMAPEQLQGASRIGPEADVFALGVILYECLEGEKPFPARGLVSYVESLRGVTPRLRGHPAWLARAVERALEKDPARRFTDGHAFARALADTEGPPLGRWAALGAAVALVATVIVALPWLRHREDRPGVPPPRAVEEPRADALAKLAEADLERYELRDAIARATSAIALDPRCALAWRVRGAARTIRGADDAAGLEDLETAFRLAPGDLLALAALAEAKRDPALIARVFAVNARLPVAFRARAGYRFLKGDLEGSLADLDEAVRMDPKDALALVARSGVHMKREEEAAALEDATRAIEVSRGALELAFITRATVHFSLRHDAASALPDLDRAIGIAPELIWVRQLRAHARFELDDLDGAGSDCTRIVELAPGTATGWLLRAKVFLRQKRVEDAVADLDRCIAIDAGNTEAFSLRARARFVQNDYEACRADSERALAISPDDAEGRLWRGMALERLGRPDEGLPDLERALRELSQEYPWLRDEVERLRAGKK
ncbi:MAG TPA: protein kinase [Planctomycetota bacterium]|nr:protein kinase [Planctomycetota bacterium]